LNNTSCNIPYILHETDRITCVYIQGELEVVPQSSQSGATLVSVTALVQLVTSTLANFCVQ